MSTETDISALYREFTDALTEVLAETAVGLARRGRLARARAALKKHPEYSFLGGGGRIQKLGSHAKRRSLGLAARHDLESAISPHPCDRPALRSALKRAFCSSLSRS